MATLKPLMTAALGLLALGVSPAAGAAGPEGPGIDAVELFREGRPARDSVENRFFLKEGRFELTPMLGYVPNNPFAQRFVGGIGMGYHFSEAFAVQGLVTYSPDLGTSDLKGLTGTLLRIADEGGTREFQQPLDKITLSFAANVVWAPLYGKINLIGETVLNFDLYFLAGVGMNSKTNYFACLEDDQVAINNSDASCTASGPATTEVVVGPNVGMGFNFFLNQSVAFKLDGRMNFYVDGVPQYDPTEPVEGNRLYNNIVVSGGVSIFFPKMQERIYDF
jgi:outer membrane beta-barrel protein